MFGNWNLSCAILAGGKAKRFNGENKALLKIGAQTNFEKLLFVTDSIFKETIVVANTPDHYPCRDIKVVKDIFKNIGPIGGIHAALKVASGNAVFFFPCDMPFLNRNLILEQIKRFNNSDCNILIPRIGEFIEPLHAIYSKSLVKKLEEHLNTVSYTHLTLPTKRIV